MEAVDLWAPLPTAMPPILSSPCALPFLQALVLLKHPRPCWDNTEGQWHKAGTQLSSWLDEQLIGLTLAGEGA